MGKGSKSRRRRERLEKQLNNKVLPTITVTQYELRRAKRRLDKYKKGLYVNETRRFWQISKSIFRGRDAKKTLDMFKTFPADSFVFLIFMGLMPKYGHYFEVLSDYGITIKGRC